MNLEDQMLNGENILHIEEFVKYKWGTEGLEDYRRESPFKFKDILKDKKYPLTTYILTLEILKSHFNNDNIAFEIGWHRARNMQLVKGKDKSGVEHLKKISTAWNKFNNFAELTITTINENKYSLKMSNYKSHPLYCERMLGFFSGLVCPDKKHLDAINKVKCVNDGDEFCEYIIKTV